MINVFVIIYLILNLKLQPFENITLPADNNLGIALLGCLQ